MKYVHYPTMSLEDCPLPCREIFTETAWEESPFNSKYIKSGGAGVEINLRHITSSRLTEVYEIATYTLDNFFADIGSWLGLLIGMSLMSLVEIAAFICTAVRERCV